MNEVGNVIALGICVFGLAEFANELSEFVMRKSHEYWTRQLTRRRLSR
jgi:hypothetical protein